MLGGYLLASFSLLYSIDLDIESYYSFSLCLSYYSLDITLKSFVVFLFDYWNLLAFFFKTIDSLSFGS